MRNKEKIESEGNQGCGAGHDGRRPDAARGIQGHRSFPRLEMGVNNA